ncbi:MAG: DUF1674 domain-containing protein [Kiloniellaceae bacterium]
MVKRFAVHRPKPAKTPATPAAQAPRAEPVPAAGEAGREGPDASARAGKPKEIGGPSGPEPTRYGDWERNGICVDF